MSWDALKGPREFDAMLDALKRGQTKGYHTGLLMRDRQSDEHLNAVATRAWDAMLAGKCKLVQRRVEVGVCQYDVVRT